MKYTEKQKAEFKVMFMQKRRYQVALLVPLGGAVFRRACCMRHVAELDLRTGVLGTAGLVLAAAAFSWLNWRCPACAKYLGIGLSPNHCPKCGVALTS